MNSTNRDTKLYPLTPQKDPSHIPLLSAAFLLPLASSKGERLLSESGLWSIVHTSSKCGRTTALQQNWRTRNLMRRPSAVVCIPSDTGLTHITKSLLTKPTEKSPAYSCENVSGSSSRILPFPSCLKGPERTCSCLATKATLTPRWDCLNGTQVQSPALPGVHGGRQGCMPVLGAQHSQLKDHFPLAFGYGCCEPCLGQCWHVSHTIQFLDMRGLESSQKEAVHSLGSCWNGTRDTLMWPCFLSTFLRETGRVFK